MVLEDLFRRPSTLTRLRLPPLGPMMDGLCEWLGCRGYSPHGIRRRMRQVSHFNRYLRRRSVEDVQDVTPRHAERFIEKHAPPCRCRGRHRHRNGGPSNSMRYLIDYLSESGLLVLPSLPSSPKQELLQEYLDHLKYERHLAETTIDTHRKYLTPVLEELGAAPVKALHKLTPEKVLALFTNHVRDREVSSRRNVRGVLRSFLRFGHQKGYLERDLAEVVPQIRRYRMSDVPRGVSDEDARKTLEGINRTTPVGRRDFAMIQLLYTYGVRGSQLRALRVEDIQWRESRIRFPACKRGKEVMEPLSEEVGESLLDYLRDGRPHALYPEVFLTVHRPYRPLRAAARLSAIVAERMRRAGVSRPKGSHAFRHGFATRMLQHGQSIKTIADLLGHRNINTTFIYTKVDMETLRQLPLGWPEV